MLGVKDGFVFLLGVLAVGTIAAAAAASLLLLGGAAQQTALSMEESAQAMEYAQSCIEHGLMELRTDQAYAGDEKLSWDRGTCTLKPIKELQEGNLTLCAEGRVNHAVRRVRVEVLRLFPDVQIGNWTKDASCPAP